MKLVPVDFRVEVIPDDPKEGSLSTTTSFMRHTLKS